MNINRNILFSLSIAAVIIVALSFFLPKNEEKYLGERFWAKKTFASASYDIIIIGDSRVYRGVSPKIMSKSLPGKKILNFAYSNCGLNQTMFKEAESKLSQENTKKVIIAGISANSLTGFTRNNEQFIREKTRPREDVFEKLYLNGILCRFSSVTPEQIIDEIKDKPVTEYYTNKYLSDGYVESEKFPRDTMEAISYYIDDFKNYKVEKQFVDELFSQVKEWNDKGIIVVGFCPPVSVTMKAIEDSLGLFKEYMIRAGFINAGGKWIDLNPNSYSTYDGSHLEKESVGRFSDELGRFVLEILKQ